MVGASSLRPVADIESVLQWAYRDELPKRRKPEALAYLQSQGHEVKTFVSHSAPAGFPSICPMFKNAALGTSISFSREPGFPGSAGEPHPDAIIIERAVASLAGVIDHLPYEDLELDAGMEGFKLDSEEIWRRGSQGLVHLVVAKAKLKCRPVVGDEMPVPRRKQGKNGHPMYVRAVTRMMPVWQGPAPANDNEESEAREKRPAVPVRIDEPSPAVKGGQYRHGTRVDLEYEPSPKQVALDRAEYGAWRLAMDHLVAELADKLTSVRVGPCLAAERPWLGESDAPTAPIREDLTAAVAQDVRRVARRRRAA
jgi:hypothetical protein